MGVAIPSRAYVGVVVFGLITALVTVPYTLLVLTGYRRPAEITAPYQILFPPQGEALAAGEILFLVLASVFSIALTVVSWKALLRGARRDAERRKRVARIKKDLNEFRLQNRPPGGFN